MALKFDNHIFYHIPKNGGTYVRRVLQQLTDDFEEILHPHSGPMKMLNRHNYENSFCVVRHPLEWYRSFFRFRKINGWKSVYASEASNPAAVLDVQCQHPGFAGFVANILNHYPSGFVTNLYLRFVPFCKYVLYQEDLNSQLYDLLSSWGYKPKKQHRVNTSVSGINTELSKNLKQRLLNAESEIIDLLGYGKKRL